MDSQPTRQDRLEACLRAILRQPDFPAISHHIQQVMSVLQDESASFRYLTSLVLRDYSLTLKVLRAANSALYNRSGRPVLSVSHAIVLLGADAIRYLAGSLALFEHYHRHSPGLKESTSKCTWGEGELGGTRNSGTEETFPEIATAPVPREVLSPASSPAYTPSARSARHCPASP